MNYSQVRNVTAHDVVREPEGERSKARELPKSVNTKVASASKIAGYSSPRIDRPINLREFYLHLADVLVSNWGQVDSEVEEVNQAPTVRKEERIGPV